LKFTLSGPPAVTKRLEVVVRVNDNVDDSCGKFMAEAALRLRVPRTAANAMHATTKERFRNRNLEKMRGTLKINLTGNALKRMSFSGYSQPES
jgi:hypothetical protein